MNVQVRFGCIAGISDSSDRLPGFYCIAFTHSNTVFLHMCDVEGSFRPLTVESDIVSLRFFRVHFWRSQIRQSFPYFRNFPCTRCIKGVAINRILLEVFRVQSVRPEAKRIQSDDVNGILLWLVAVMVIELRGTAAMPDIIGSLL